MAERGVRASKLRKAYSKYPAIEETNFKVDDVGKAIKRIEAAYPEAQKDWFDGLTLRTESYWINVRPSSNEPLLRLNMEAKNEGILSDEFAKIRSLLPQS